MKTLALATLTTILAAPAFAVTISAYDPVNTTSVAADIEGAGVTAADLTRGPDVNLAGTVGGNAFRSNNFTLGGDAATALAAGDYIEWGFTSTVAYDVDTVSIGYDRNTRGPQAIALFASFNGGAFSQVFDDTSVSASGETAAISLTADDVVSATFRLVGWNADRNGGRLIIRRNQVGPNSDYGISVSGELSVVPLPTTLPLLLGGLGLVGWVRRKG